MARELAEYPIVVIKGTSSAPVTCDCNYRVDLGDLSEPPGVHGEGSPDFNQQVDVFVPAVVAAVKKTAGLVRY